MIHYMVSTWDYARANTIEEKVLKKVKAKINNIEALNKGDLALFGFDFEEYKKQEK